MGTIGLGGGLLIIAFSTQWLISKRLKNPKLRNFYSWIAWIGAVVGGTALATDVGNLAGVSSAGAVVASLVMLLFIAVDLADKRPDWLAFILIALAPLFMRMSGGGAGAIFDALLAVPAWAASGLGAFLGI